MRTVRLTRGRAGAATAAVAGITSAVAMLGLDPAPVHAASTTDWASGVAASGPVNLPATPTVSSGGVSADKSLATLPANSLLSAKVLHVRAGAGYARSAVADLKLGQELSASLVEATCRNGTGDSRLADAVVGGHRLPAGVAPNTTIAVPPGQGAITRLVLNKQVPDGHGGVKVTAIEVALRVAGIAENVGISTADCAGIPAGSGSAPPPSAPAPKPRQGTLPVTG